jgi:hypothetical protein
LGCKLASFARKMLYNVAASLVTTGRFADPFGYPSGLTAHVGMLTPLPSALAYWLFGVGSPRAEYLLSAWTAHRRGGPLGNLGPPPHRAAASSVRAIVMAPMAVSWSLHSSRSWQVTRPSSRS